MTPELKKRWVTALRSGEYKQGKTYLCKNNKYCCLGVLAEIEGKFITKTVQGVKYTKDGSTSMLSAKMLQDFGLTDAYLTGVTSTLVRMNDEYSCDFNYIADYIDKKL